MSSAAEQGYAQAQINLGDLYVEQRHLPGLCYRVRFVQPRFWGDPRAATRIKNLSRLTTAKQRIEGENRARAWSCSHRNLDLNE